LMVWIRSIIRTRRVFCLPAQDLALQLQAHRSRTCVMVLTVPGRCIAQLLILLILSLPIYKLWYRRHRTMLTARFLTSFLSTPPTTATAWMYTARITSNRRSPATTALCRPACKEIRLVEPQKPVATWVVASRRILLDLQAYSTANSSFHLSRAAV